MLKVADVQWWSCRKVCWGQTYKKYAIWDNFLPDGEFVAFLDIRAKNKSEAISSWMGKSDQAGKCGTLGRNEHRFYTDRSFLQTSGALEENFSSFTMISWTVTTQEWGLEITLYYQNVNSALCSNVNQMLRTTREEIEGVILLWCQFYISGTILSWNSVSGLSADHQDG